MLASLGVLDDAEPDIGAPEYALRTWQGRVAVFCPPDADEPQAAADRDSAMRLLEDLSA